MVIDDRSPNYKEGLSSNRGGGGIFFMILLDKS